MRWTVDALPFGGGHMDCEHDAGRTLFCGICGKERNRGDLKRVKLMGFVGTEQSTSPKIEAFWASGDPNVLL